MKKFTIMLVDDNPHSLKLLDAICTSENYNTVTAADGQEAMDLLAEQPVDLIITDVLMPNVDGYYLCYKIRNHDRYHNLPIIIYTATYTSLSEVKIAEEMGADLFIRKPAPMKALLDGIRELLDNPKKRSTRIVRAPGSFEVMHQYSSDLVSKLEQRNIELEGIRKNLERLVLERTRQLQNVNEELSASNEELTAANEELAAINDKLIDATQLIQQQSDTIIRQKDEQLNKVLDSTNDVIWSIDLTTNGQSYISRSVEHITGIPVSEVIKDLSVWKKFIHPDDLHLREASLERMKTADESLCTYRFVDQHNELHWMRERIRVERDVNGQPLRRFGIASDITSLKKAEIALGREKNLLRTLIDNIPDYIYIKDRDLRHILNNKANLSLLGVENEKETLGKTTVDYFGSEGALYLEDDRAVMRTGEPIINKEEKLTTVAGNQRIFLTTKVPLRDDNNNITGIIGISRDVTEHRKQEEVLHQYRVNLDILFSSTSEQILLVDIEGRVVLFNNAFENALIEQSGKKPVVGELLWEIGSEGATDIAFKLFTQAKQGDDIFTTVTIPSRHGELLYEVHYEPVFEEGLVKYVSIISVDVTERRRNQKELQHNRHLLDKANEVAGIGYWSFDPASNINEWSLRTRNIFGWGKDQFSVKGFLAIVHPDDRHRVEQTVGRTFAEGKSYDIEHRIIRPVDGRMRWVHIKADFINPGVKTSLLVGVVQDITEQKTIQEVLTEYNERYEILAKATNDAIWDWDVEHDFEIWNHGIQTIFGYPEREVHSAREWRNDKVHPEDCQRVNAEITRAFDLKLNHWTSQYQYKCADGSYKHVLDRAYIIYHNQQPIRVIGAMQDITDQKKFEESITAIAREMSELIEKANTPIFGTDRNGYVNEWNKVTAVLTGYSRDEVIGKKITQFTADSQRDGFIRILQQVVDDVPFSDLQLPIIARDGKELIILLNATPRKSRSQQITGVLMVGQNITELIEYRHNLEMNVRERTRELNDALQKEKELVEMKSRFVSIASHEFRTPLSTIALVSGLVKRHHKSMSVDEVDAKMATIDKQVNHMTYLLDDILMIGKTEAGKIEASHAAIDIEEFFRQTSREVEESTKTHRILIELSTTLQTFDSDEKLLRNITINLLTNAIKFSPESSTVSLRLSNTFGYLKIEIEDSGIGIPEADQAAMFTSFHRGSNVGDIQGTGLGLSIVKKAVDLLHGDIEVRSMEGKGTLFIVKLPV